MGRWPLWGFLRARKLWRYRLSCTDRYIAGYVANCDLKTRDALRHIDTDHMSHIAHAEKSKNIEAATADCRKHGHQTVDKSPCS